MPCGIKSYGVNQSSTRHYSSEAFEDWSQARTKSPTTLQAHAIPGLTAGAFWTGPFPTSLGSVAPEHLQIVVTAAIRVEEMNDNVNKVDQDPSGLGQTANRKGLMVRLGPSVGHLPGKAGHLTIRCACGDEEKVCNRRKPSKIKNDNVRAVAVQSQSS